MPGNANSGARPTPRAIKEARGTIRADRDGDAEELPDIPAAPEGTPPPDWLRGEAVDEWNRVVPVLEKARVLSAVDFTQLGNYCHSHGLSVEASKKVQREGLLKKRANGSLVAHPLIKVAQEARAQALRLAIEYGLTPAARTRIRKTEEENPDLPEGRAPTAPKTDGERFLFEQPPLVLVGSSK